MERRRRGSEVYTAVVGGGFAAVGSVLGKMAGGVGVATWGSLLLSGALFVLMIVSNTYGCRCYVSALNSCGSSLQPTIASAATNYICTAFAGMLLFGETTSTKWWCGSFLIMLGLLLICHDSPTKEDELAKEEHGRNADGKKFKHQ